MIKHILLITLLLIPFTTHGHEWDFNSWLERFVDNDINLTICYTYLLDDDPDTFMNECDIHGMAMNYEDLMIEFYSELDINHPGMPDVVHITDHFDGVLLPIPLPLLQRYFRIQDRKKATIITLLLAENLLYSDK